jgi:hypothetical protein
MKIEELREALVRSHGGEDPLVVLAELCARNSPPRASVGRMVHVRVSGACRAAVVTEIAARDARREVESLHLHVLAPDQVSMLRNVPRARASGEDGSWHWPEREV